jgi:hypothetical protein
MAIKVTRLKEEIPAGGNNTITIDLAKNYDRIVISVDSGATALTASQIVTTTGTEEEGMILEIYYPGGVTSDVATTKFVTIMGTNLTDAQALNAGKIDCYYNGTAWEVKYFTDLSGALVKFNGTDIVSESVTTTQIKPATIAAGDKAPLGGEGFIPLGGVGGTWGELDASGDMKVLIANGITLQSLALFGAFTLANTGEATIPNGYITAAMLNFNIDPTIFVASIIIPEAEVLTLNTAKVLVVAAPASGKYISILNAEAHLPVYAGTPYAANTTLELINQTAGVGRYEEVNLLASTSAKTNNFIKLPGSGGTVYQVTHEALYVRVKTGNPTNAGTGSDINIYITYMIKDFL